jgi:Family of unknown function (DUF6504)
VPLRFVSEPIVPRGDAFDPVTIARGEPALPPEFAWGEERLSIRALRRTWRTTKVDRGDTYVKRHYFECEMEDGRIAVVYFERQARRAEPRWHLYTIETSEPAT